MGLPLEQVSFTGDRDGDIKAFNEIHAKYEHEIYVFCSRFLGDIPLAEDVTSEVFVQLWRNREDNILHVGGFLYKTARNRCIDMIRTDPRLRGRVISLNEGGEYYNSPSGSYNPEEEIAKIDAERWKSRLLTTKMLTSRQKHIIRLSVVDGLSSTEIAGSLGVTVNSIYNHWAKIKKVVGPLLKRQRLPILLIVLGGLGIYFLKIFLFPLCF